MKTLMAGRAQPMICTRVEWDTPLWGYIRHFEAVLPGLPAGSVVRYRIGAGHPTGGGPAAPDLFADDGLVYSYYVDATASPATRSTAAPALSPAWAENAVVYQVPARLADFLARHDAFFPRLLSALFPR